MKTYLLIAFISFSFIIKAEDLKCSANGLSVLHIPGAFTSKNNQDGRQGAKVRVTQVLDENLKMFDLKEQSAVLIPIASQGLVQDKLNYIIKSYGDVYGKDAEDAAWLTFGISEFGYNLNGDIDTVVNSGKTINKLKTTKTYGTITNPKVSTVNKVKEMYGSFLNLSSSSAALVTQDGSQTILQTLTSEDGKDNYTRLGKYLSMTTIFGGNVFSSIGILNYASLSLLENNYEASVDQHRSTLLATYWTTNDNVEKISKNIKEQLDSNKKVIINAHAEGNQLASRAIAQLRSDSQYSDKINKFVSILSTSPTTESYLSKYHYMKNSNDLHLLGGVQVPITFIIKPELKSENSWDSIKTAFMFNTGSASNFLDYYVSSVNQGKEIGGNSFSPVRDIYIKNLRLAAEDLDNNCESPILKITPTSNDIILNQLNVFTANQSIPVKGTVLSFSIQKQKKSFSL